MALRQRVDIIVKGLEGIVDFAAESYDGSRSNQRIEKVSYRNRYRASVNIVMTSTLEQAGSDGAPAPVAGKFTACSVTDLITAEGKHWRHNGETSRQRKWTGDTADVESSAAAWPAVEVSIECSATAPFSRVLEGKGNLRL